jgi:hypothetical protein
MVRVQANLSSECVGEGAMKQLIQAKKNLNLGDEESWRFEEKVFLKMPCEQR